MKFRNKTNKPQKSLYKPINESKYIGVNKDIVCRSSWERKFCNFLDRNSSVLNWASESVVVPYICKTDNKWHRYYVDFFVEFSNNERVLFEVKPYNETQPPKKSKNVKTQSYKIMTYIKNCSKWEYAKRFANSRGWKFYIFTEKDFEKYNIKLK